MAELLSIKEGLSNAWKYGHRQNICETNCRESFEAIQLRDTRSCRAHLHYNVIQEITLLII